MEQEGFLHKESEFDKLCKSKAEEGWHFVGRENLTSPKFSDEAKFEEVSFQTEDEIREKYLQFYKKSEPNSELEVDLVLDENTEKLRRIREICDEEEYCNILSNLKEEDRNYLVFVRNVAK